MPTHEQIFQNLAGLDPDYPAFVAQLPNELTRAAEPMPEGLAEDMLALLRAERPELSEWLDKPSAPPSRFLVESAAGVGWLLAILFLLRAHIKFEGANYLIEIKPMDSDLLKKILDMLSDHLSNKSK